mgnify:FL=1
MSFLYLAMGTRGYKLNVLSFSSPVFGTMSSVQTRYMEMHFPIKSIQPEIKLDVQFASEEEYENFQRFVRGHQQRALFNPNVGNVIWLNWPERGIDNWTGVIKAFRAGGERRVFAPRASFIVDLIDSMVSSRTDVASLASSWRAIYGEGMGPGAVLAPPTQAERDLAKENNWGSYDNAPTVNGWGSPNGGVTAGSR